MLETKHETQQTHLDCCCTAAANKKVNSRHTVVRTDGENLQIEEVKFILELNVIHGFNVLVQLY